MKKERIDHLLCARIINTFNVFETFINTGKE